MPSPGSAGSIEYVTPVRSDGNVTVGGTTTPPVHVAATTPGTPGPTGRQPTSSNVTSKVAVTSSTNTQPPTARSVPHANTGSTPASPSTSPSDPAHTAPGSTVYVDVVGLRQHQRRLRQHTIGTHRLRQLRRRRGHVLTRRTHQLQRSTSPSSHQPAPTHRADPTRTRPPTRAVTITDTAAVPSPGSAGSIEYVTPVGPVGNVTVGGTTTPPVHVAATTPGTPAPTGMTADIIERDLQGRPSHRRRTPTTLQRLPPHPTPRSRQGRRQRHRLTRRIRPGRLDRVRRRRRSHASTNDGSDNTPSAHTACVNSGAAGVTSSHDAPTNSNVNVAVVASTRTHPPS